MYGQLGTEWRREPAEILLDSGAILFPTAKPTLLLVFADYNGPGALLIDPP